MLAVRLCIYSARPLEDPLENSRWNKITKMQLMWLYIHSGRHFEDSLENSLWNKTIQMQPLWLCIWNPRQFEKTLKNSFWRKNARINSMIFCICLGGSLKMTSEYILISYMANDKINFKTTYDKCVCTVKTIVNLIKNRRKKVKVWGKVVEEKRKREMILSCFDLASVAGSQYPET